MLHLRLPNAMVTLRGDVPSGVATSLLDLSDARLHHAPAVATVDLAVSVTDLGWSVTERSGGAPLSSAIQPQVMEAGPNEADLLDSLVGRLNRLAFAADPTRLHLHAAGLEVRGDGILLAGPKGSGKSTVALELLRRGSSYLSDESVTLSAGSRTMYAYPKPLTLKGAAIDRARSAAGGAFDLATAGNGRAHLRAGVLGPVAPYAEPRVVVVVRFDPTGPRFAPITSVETCVHLLGDALDAARTGPGALEILGAVASAVSGWELVYGDAAEAAEMILEIRPSLRRQLTVFHRFDRDPTPEARRSRFVSPDRSVRVARFDDGAVLFDGPTGTLLPLGPDAAGLVEAAHVDGLTAEELADGPPELAEVLGDVVPVRASHPGESLQWFGLPDNPVGGIAHGPPLTAPDVRRAIGGRCSGVAAEQLRRGRAADPDVAERIDRSHLGAQATCLLLERELCRVFEMLEARGVVPVVLKGPVSALDGPLPPHLRDHGDVDLLVPPDQIDIAVEVLVDAGFARRFPKLSEDFDRRFCKSVTLSGTFAAGRVGRTFELDVHRTLVPGPFGFRVPIDELHDRAVPVRIGGRWYRSLHPVHRFVHHCLHLALGSPVPRLHSLRDVVLSAPRTPAELDDVIEVITRWGVAAPVRRSLSMVSCGRCEEVVGLLATVAHRTPLSDRILLASYHRGRRSYALGAVATTFVLHGWDARAAFVRAHLHRPSRGGALRPAP